MKKAIIFMIMLAMLAPLTFSYTGDTEEDNPQYYEDAKVLRIKYTEGETYVKRDYDEGNEEGTVNLPIFEKDTAGTTDGRLEIYIGRLNYLRLDYDTEVVFDKVPELRKTDMALRIIRGGIYLDVESIDYERDIEIQTPDCGVFLLDKGMYRINVNEAGRTEVYVINGVAEVAGENYSRNVRENQKIVMNNGQVKERPFYFNASENDDFDLWSRDRDKNTRYARYGNSQYMESGYEDYEYELSRSGHWKYNSSYSSYIWIPYTTPHDWSPYSNGRWVWTPYYGYVWTSYDTWGYFTHHYGRWGWDTYSGWYWIPGYRWSPAWVSWSWDDNYYCWSPLSWYNRPIIIINNRWDHHYDYHRHGFPIHSRSTIIIKKNHLTAPLIKNMIIKDRPGDNYSRKSIIYRGRGPNNRPEISKVNYVNAKGRTVVYKENSILVNNKFKSRTNGNTNDLPSRTVDRKSAVFKYSAEDAAKRKTDTIRDRERTFDSRRDESKGNSDNSGMKIYRSTRINRNSDNIDNNTDKTNDTGKSTMDSPFRYKPQPRNRNDSDNTSSSTLDKANTNDTEKSTNDSPIRYRPLPGKNKTDSDNSTDSNSGKKEKGESKSTSDSPFRYHPQPKNQTDSGKTDSSKTTIRDRGKSSSESEGSVITKKKKKDGEGYPSFSSNYSPSDRSSGESNSRYRYNSSTSERVETPSYRSSRTYRSDDSSSRYSSRYSSQGSDENRSSFRSSSSDTPRRPAREIGTTTRSFGGSSSEYRSRESGSSRSFSDSNRGFTAPTRRESGSSFHSSPFSGGGSSVRSHSGNSGSSSSSGGASFAKRKKD